MVITTIRPPTSVLIVSDPTVGFGYRLNADAVALDMPGLLSVTGFTSIPHDPTQPVDDAVKLIVTEPALTAVMKPVVAVTPATPAALLLHVPPLTLDNAVSVSPTVMIDGALITGVTFTSIDFVL